jgi:hypothetical protein
MAKIFVPQIPQILLRKHHEIEIDGPKLGFSGHFTFQHRRNGIIIFEGHTKDLVLDQGLKHMAENANAFMNYLTYCVLGTGSTVPTSTDTALEAADVSTAKVYSSVSYALGSLDDRYMRIIWEYGLTEAVGTWTEVGVGWSSTGIFDRSLIKDTGGNTVSITKASGTDTLTIYFDLHVIRSSDTPTENTITISGVGSVTVQSLIPNCALEGLVKAGCQFNYMTGTSSYIRLGTGTDALSTTQTACHTPINYSPTQYATYSYVSGALYREYLVEYSAGVVGTFAEFAFDCIYGSNCPTILMRFLTVVPKTDDTVKTRLVPRITLGRAA